MVLVLGVELDYDLVHSSAFFCFKDVSCLDFILSYFFDFFQNQFLAIFKLDSSMNCIKSAYLFI